MKITLTKPVKVEQLEFIGEVNFFDDQSPYIELLKNTTSQDDLEDELQHRGLSSAAIKNVMDKLDCLGVLKHGHIQSLEHGFPEKEYGKYQLVIYENDTTLPFIYKNKEIERIDANSYQNYNALIQDSELIDKVRDKDNKAYRVDRIENNKANITELASENLKIIYENGDWRYVLNAQSFEMSGISFNSLFEGRWDVKNQALTIDFESVKAQVNAPESMEYSFNASVYIDQYGQLNTNFTNIPVIPKSQIEARLWFVYLLKNEIEKKNRYISESELQSLWSNLLSNKPKFRQFDLVFDFDLILREFGKESRYYWLLKASVDLYPFANKLMPKNRVIIQDEEDIDLETTLVNQFNIDEPQHLIIVDRWIVNLQQYQALEKIIEAFGNPQTTIITQEVKERRSEQAINDIIRRNHIRRLIKSKRDIVHQRYWKIDEQYYQTSESLDFLTIEDDAIRTKYVTFELYDEEDLDSNLLRLVEAN